MPNRLFRFFNLALALFVLCTSLPTITFAESIDMGKTGNNHGLSNESVSISSPQFSRQPHTEESNNSTMHSHERYSENGVFLPLCSHSFLVTIDFVCEPYTNEYHKCIEMLVRTCSFCNLTIRSETGNELLTEHFVENAKLTEQGLYEGICRDCDALVTFS